MLCVVKVIFFKNDFATNEKLSLIGGLFFYLLEFNFASNLKISKYNHIRVTRRPKAPYHSIYLGAPFSAPSSIKSKSKTRFNDAITTTKRLKPILNMDELLISIIPI